MRNRFHLTEREHNQYIEENKLEQLLKYLTEEDKLFMLLQYDSIKFYYKEEEFHPYIICACCDGNRTLEKYEDYPYLNEVYTTRKLILGGIRATRVVMQDRIDLEKQLGNNAKQNAKWAFNQYKKAYNEALEDIFKNLQDNVNIVHEKLKKQINN